jgi:hypothetical protein
MALDIGFVDKLVELATKIKRDASGRVCSDCKHMRRGWCAEQLNYSGDNLVVMYPNAVACAKFEALS